MINDNEYGSESRGQRELFNKVHRYGVSWFLRNKLFYVTVRLMPRNLSVGADHTG